MSGTIKKTNATSEAMKGTNLKANASNAIGDGVQSSKKRTGEELEPKPWAPLNRLVFVTKGCGIFKDNLKVHNGVQKNLFWILGTCADGKILVLQVWGAHAKIFHDLFINLAEPDFAPTLWVVPVPKAKGLYFRESKANDFQQKNHSASFCLVLDYAKQESAPFSSLTRDAYPSKFDWADGQYDLDGSIIPHYRQWGETTTTTDLTAELINYVPPMRSYDDASPLKVRRTESSSSSAKKIAPSDLEFNDE